MCERERRGSRTGSIQKSDVLVHVTDCPCALRLVCMIVAMCISITFMSCWTGYIQVCRGLMIAAVCLGFFGSIFALIGMKCTRIGGSDKIKARIAFFAGFNFILSGNSTSI